MEIDLTKITNPDIRNLLSDSGKPESLAKGFFLLGVEAEGKENWEGAIEYYKVVVGINPTDPVLRYFAPHNIAYSMIQLGRLMDAGIYAQSAIAVNQDWPHAYNLFGIPAGRLASIKRLLGPSSRRP